MAQEVLKGLSDPLINTETIHLDDCRVFFCKHCEACHKKILYCSLKDDAAAIIKKMLEADGIIFATPNYINQVTASMKALFERASHFIHCKRLLGKYAAGVVSSGSGQDKEVLDYIRFYAHICGAQYSGGVSCVAQSLEEKKEEAFRLGKKLAVDMKEKKIYPEQSELIEKAKLHFGRIIEARKKEWEQEYWYWQDKGWLE